MPKVIWTNNSSTGAVITDFPVNGEIQVDVSGTLDEADLITSYIGANSVPTMIRSLSWMNSQGDTINGADGGIAKIHNRKLQFALFVPMGSVTSISLQYDTEDGLE